MATRINATRAKPLGATTRAPEPVVEAPKVTAVKAPTREAPKRASQTIAPETIVKTEKAEVKPAPAPATQAKEAPVEAKVEKKKSATVWTNAKAKVLLDKDGHGYIKVSRDENGDLQYSSVKLSGAPNVWKQNADVVYVPPYRISGTVEDILETLLGATEVSGIDANASEAAKRKAINAVIRDTGITNENHAKNTTFLAMESEKKNTKPRVLTKDDLTLEKINEIGFRLRQNICASVSSNGKFEKMTMDQVYAKIDQKKEKRKRNVASRPKAEGKQESTTSTVRTGQARRTAKTPKPVTVKS